MLERVCLAALLCRPKVPRLWGPWVALPRLCLGNWWFKLFTSPRIHKNGIGVHFLVLKDVSTVVNDTMMRLQVLLRRGDARFGSYRWQSWLPSFGSLICRWCPIRVIVHIYIMHPPGFLRIKLIWQIALFEMTWCNNFQTRVLDNIRKVLSEVWFILLS